MELRGFRSASGQRRTRWQTTECKKGEWLRKDVLRVKLGDRWWVGMGGLVDRAESDCRDECRGEVSERWQGRRVWRETHTSGQTGDKENIQKIAGTSRKWRWTTTKANTGFTSHRSGRFLSPLAFEKFSRDRGLVHCSCAQVAIASCIVEARKGSKKTQLPFALRSHEVFSELEGRPSRNRDAMLRITNKQLGRQTGSAGS